MANPMFICNGPHDGPCPIRLNRLVRETAEQDVVFSGGSAEDVFRQIVEMGRGGEDLHCEAWESGDCPHGLDKPYYLVES